MATVFLSSEVNRHKPASSLIRREGSSTCTKNRDIVLVYISGYRFPEMSRVLVLARAALNDQDFRNNETANVKLSVPC